MNLPIQFLPRGPQCFLFHRSALSKRQLLDNSYLNNLDLGYFQDSVVRLVMFETAKHFLNTERSYQLRLTGWEGKAVWWSCFHKCVKRLITRGAVCVSVLYKKFLKFIIKIISGLTHRFSSEDLEFQICRHGSSKVL